MISKKVNELLSQPGIPVVSLFSGCGGLDLGFFQAGFRPVLAVDVDPAACITYEANHPHGRVLKKNLSDLSSGYICQRLEELPAPVRPVGVIGGPPCQAFSLGNVHKNGDDPRARLPEWYAKVLKELNTSFGLDFFVFENVRGLKHKMHAEIFTRFKQLFAAAGFHIVEGELDAQDFGVAQVRKRVFVVGWNNKKYGKDFTFRFPKGQAVPRTVRDVIGDLPEPALFNRALKMANIPVHPNHWAMMPRSKRFFDGSLRNGSAKGRPFRVLDWDKPSWTVAYGHREVHIHPDGKRRLSVYEAMLVQGFPADYRLHGTLSDQLRLVSDAVPPPMAKALGEAVMKALLNEKKKNSISSGRPNTTHA